jgi:hypothetical protein
MGPASDPSGALTHSSQGGKRRIFGRRPDERPGSSRSVIRIVCRTSLMSCTQLWERSTQLKWQRDTPLSHSPSVRALRRSLAPTRNGDDGRTSTRRAVIAQDTRENGRRVLRSPVESDRGRCGERAHRRLKTAQHQESENFDSRLGGCRRGLRPSPPSRFAVD